MMRKQRLHLGRTVEEIRARDLDIGAALVNGEPPAAIAARHAITVRRVHQVWSELVRAMREPGEPRPPRDHPSWRDRSEVVTEWQLRNHTPARLAKRRGFWLLQLERLAREWGLSDGR